MYLKLPLSVRNVVLSLIGLEIVTNSTEIEQEEELISDFGLGITPKILRDTEKEWIERYIIN